MKWKKPYRGKNKLENVIQRDNFLKDTKKRNTVEYRKWKESVFYRDQFKCQTCGQSVDITAHHIKPFSKDKHKRYDVDNGITLCSKCHKRIHKKKEKY